MVENIGSVREVQVERIRPPEPQSQPPRPPSRSSSEDGEAIPPSGIAMLADTSGAALLRVQEAVGQGYGSADNLIGAADTDGDKALARDELQKLLERNMGEQAASDSSAAADRMFRRIDANHDQQVSADELDAGKARARSINIGA